MSKIIEFTPTKNGVVRDMTAEEQAVNDGDVARADTDEQARIDAITNQENLKASAKAKLIAGTALTEDEANTIVL